jgi:hypothetical protein
LFRQRKKSELEINSALGSVRALSVPSGNPVAAVASIVP